MSIVEFLKLFQIVGGVSTNSSGGLEAVISHRTGTASLLLAADDGVDGEIAIPTDVTGVVVYSGDPVVGVLVPKGPFNYIWGNTHIDYTKDVLSGVAKDILLTYGSYNSTDGLVCEINTLPIDHTNSSFSGYIDINIFGANVDHDVTVQIDARRTGSNFWEPYDTVVVPVVYSTGFCTGTANFGTNVAMGARYALRVSVLQSTGEAEAVQIRMYTTTSSYQA